MAEERTLYISNLAENVTKELLEEIFTQVGPVESVSVIAGATRYAFVQFIDEESVPFSIKVMDGLKLYNVPITVKPRAGTAQDRIYKSQHGHHQNHRRHSSGPSRREPPNDYVSDYHPHSARRTDSTGAYTTSRYNQTPGQHPLHSFIPPYDPFATPSGRQRTVGGYYSQQNRSNSAGHRSSNHHHHNNNNGNPWR